MNNLTSKLLSLPESGNFIRLILSKNPEGGVFFDVEGGGSDAENLHRQISAVFQAELLHGNEFEHRPVNGLAEDSILPSSFLEILPLGHRVSSVRSNLGFNCFAEGSEREKEEAQLFVPSFPIAPNGLFSAPPFFLALSHEAVNGVEIEFSRWTLPESWEGLLERTIQQRGSTKSALAGTNRIPDPLCYFLGQWLYLGTGWKVRFRVKLNTVEVPALGAILELAGQGFFGTACKTRQLRPQNQHCDYPGEAIDLSSCFPEGWAFPDILPTEESLDHVVARRKYQMTVPELPREGILIGMVEEQQVRLPEATRDRHTYIAGATGTGKSTLLKKLIHADLQSGESLVLLDPHGDLFREVLEMVPEERQDDVFVIDPGSGSKPPGFNILQLPRDRFFRRRVEFLIGEILRFFQETWQMPEAFGPMFETYFRNGMLLLLLQDRIPVTVLDFMKVFSDEDFRKQLIEANGPGTVTDFRKKVATQTKGDISLENVTPYIVSKMNVLTTGGFLTEMVEQPDDMIRLEERINSKKIILINLDKGLLGPAESRLLGVLFTMQLFTAGLKRSLVPPGQRPPVNVYIDEFQNFISDNISSMLSEARKFGLRLHLANQTLSQLRSGHGTSDLLESVLGNVGNLILFRLGVPDAERLKSHFEPFTRQQIQELKNYHALARLLTEEGPIRPVILKTLNGTDSDPDSIRQQLSSRQNEDKPSKTRPRKQSRKKLS